MKTSDRTVIYFFAATLLVFGYSCNILSSDKTELKKTLDPVEEVTPIEGADNVSMVVNKTSNAYFTIAFSDIQPNDIIGNGSGEGWCIDWTMGINAANGKYNGIKLYSTYMVEKWKPINYLLNIKDELIAGDTAITFNEIQVAIWSLRGSPEFDLDKIAVKDLPGDMLKNGKPKFSYGKVDEVLEKVNADYKNFEYSKDKKFVVIAETPKNVQTVIRVVE